MEGPYYIKVSVVRSPYIEYQKAVTLPKTYGRNGLQAYRFLKPLVGNKVEGLEARRTRVRNSASIESEDLKPTTGEAGL